MWRDPAYAQLTLEGSIANDVQLCGLLRHPAHAVVCDLDKVPYLDTGSEPVDRAVLPDTLPPAPTNN